MISLNTVVSHRKDIDTTDRGYSNDGFRKGKIFFIKWCWK